MGHINWTCLADARFLIFYFFFILTVADNLIQLCLVHWPTCACEKSGTLKNVLLQFCFFVFLYFFFKTL